MQSLILLSWLGTTVAATAPVVIEVPSHTLATVQNAKPQRPPTDLQERAAHAMTATVGADGRVYYECRSAAHTHDLRVDTRAARQEK